MAGIYIHIPFCLKACHYCDFHFTTSFKTKDQIITAIIQELQLRKNYLHNSTIKTIYFGGGTPSVLDVRDIEKILQTIHRNFIISNSLECTLEANPNDLRKKKIIDYIDLGINRISLGGQSFNNEQLKKLNRTHTSSEIESAIKSLQDLGIININLDLMYGLPDLTNKLWRNNLQKAIDLKITHLSCYCLTIEKGTAFHKMVKRGIIQIDSDEKIKSQFLIMKNLLTKNHFIHYEISNFCQPSYESKHNTSYWNGNKYLGVGPSAHSYNGQKRHWNIKNNFKYIHSLKKGGVFYEEELLSRENIINEYILTRLRTSKGLSLKNLALLTTKLEYENLLNQMHNFTEDRLLFYKNDIFFLTDEGMILCDKITSDLFLV